MANSFQKLADILNIETARLSGDPRRLQLASQMQETKELKQATAQSEAEINKAIDESNLPESQKRLFKSLPYQARVKVLVEAQKPEKGLTPNEMVKMEEAKVLKTLENAEKRIQDGTLVLKEGQTILDILTPYQKNIYDNYIRGGSINPFMEALAKQIGGSTATPPPVSKTYTVTSGIYKGDSADDIISNAKNLNPQLTREEVIKNLISQGIIAEG
jgi:hypothetical protein